MSDDGEPDTSKVIALLTAAFNDDVDLVSDLVAEDDCPTETLFMLVAWVHGVMLSEFEGSEEDLPTMWAAYLAEVANDNEGISE